MYNTILILLAFGLAVVNGQRTVPGVPPQNYQQPPQQYQNHPQQQQYQHHPQQNLPPGVSPQQYQQQQMHQQQQMQYQQVPVQQQPPVQQVPAQVPVHQQVPQQGSQGHGGGHHAPHGHHDQQQVLNTANIQHEREHIQEHMQVPIDTSKMSDAELQFHYFKMHDSDNNNKLDGCELIKSLIHWHVEDEGGKEENIEKKDTEENIEKNNKEEKNAYTYTDEKLVDIIDYVLKTMDLNNDGYVDYTEYRKSEQSSAKENKQ